MYKKVRMNFGTAWVGGGGYCTAWGEGGGVLQDYLISSNELIM